MTALILSFLKNLAPEAITLFIVPILKRALTPSADELNQIATATGVTPDQASAVISAYDAWLETSFVSKL
jgi:hypothetical protein